MSLGYTIMTARDYIAQIQQQIRKRRRSEKELGKTPVADAQEPVRTPIFIPTPAPFMYANTTATQQRQAMYYGSPRALVEHQLLAMLLFIILLWAFFVLNIELVIRWYRPTSDSSILPMFLIVLPLVNLISALNEFGIKPTKHVDRMVKVSMINDNEFESRRK
ncbi:hypothetical protein B0H14DRAFT_2597902 [Mycena olivaceomarginata]|nr:hypothetical protein B0H14DRAFT_2597902 [Mycena olivaceomarginata]